MRDHTNTEKKNQASYAVIFKFEKRIILRLMKSSVIVYRFCFKQTDAYVVLHNSRSFIEMCHEKKIITFLSWLHDLTESDTQKSSSSELLPFNTQKGPFHSRSKLHVHTHSVVKFGTSLSLINCPPLSVYPTVWSCVRVLGLISPTELETRQSLRPL